MPLRRMYILLLTIILHIVIFVVPVLGAYMVIAIVFLMNFSFIIIYCPFCLLLLLFVCLFSALMSVLSDMAESAYLLLMSLSSIPSSLAYVCLIELK